MNSATKCRAKIPSISSFVALTKANSEEKNRRSQEGRDVCGDTDNGRNLRTTQLKSSVSNTGQIS